MLFALFCAIVGAGLLGAILAYYIMTNLDEIPEGEEPYFTFTTEKNNGDNDS